MIRLIFILSILFLQLISLKAQELNIQVMVHPPYSLNLSDYLEKGNNVLILVTNTSSSTQEFKLIPSIEGNNGVMAAVKDEFQPLSPIVMGPGETRSYTFNQLRSINGNISESDLTLTGISLDPIKQAGVLPEGMYTLCVRALRFNTNEQISGTASCAFFNITAYDPPIILMPQNGSEIIMPQPQLVNFQWTPSGISGKTRYTIRIIDMTMVNVFNPNDAFDNPNIPPYFEQSNLIATAFSYDMSRPKLHYNREYAVQVIAYDPQGETSYKNNGRSQAHVFSLESLPIAGGPDLPGPQEPGGGIQGPGDFGINPGGGTDDDDPGIQPDLDEDDVADCMSAAACSIPEPTCAGASAPSPGVTVKVGKFLMTVDQIQGGSGKGNILIAHMNTRIEVSFQNLMVNGDGMVCGASQIWASGHGNLIPDNLLKDHNGTYDDQNLNWPDINTYVHGNNKKASNFHPDNPPQKVPFNLDFGPEQLTILGIIFTPTAAYANMATSATIPLAGNVDLFSFGGKGICVRPNGFGVSEAEGRFSLSHDLTISQSGKYSFVLEGGEGGSFVIFDCKGVKELKLKGKVEFDRNILLPVSGDEKVVPGETKFSISFDGTFSNWADWIMEGSTSHPMFTSTQADGFKMGFESILLDFSRTKNANNTPFPENHPYFNQPVKNDWTGFILNNPVLKLPDYLKKSNHDNIEVNISNIVLDNEGLWLLMDIQNILANTSEGSIGGWGFSISQLNLDIRKSMLQGGGLEGQVNLPITEAGLGYNASFEAGDGQNSMKIEFGIELQDQLDVDMIFAKMEIEANSTFGVEIEDGKAIPSAVLHGSLEIGWSSDSDKKPNEQDSDGVGSLSFPKVEFQDFHIFNDANDMPQLSLQSLQLANLNAQGHLVNFPVKIKNNPKPKFENLGNNEVGFSFGLELTLSKDNGNGFSADTDLAIIAKYDPQKKRYVFDRIQLKCIGLDIDVAVAEIKGQICIYNNDPEFGDGFSGRISATIKGLGFSAEMALQIGNVDNFDYFYFEARAKSNTGFPITASMSLYGFGGGFYYNMTRSQPEVTTIDGYDNANIPDKPAPGYSPSNLSYTPAQGNIGFMATVVFGLTGGPTQAAAFNGDLTFWMEFSKSNGIESMGLDGNGYAMQSLIDRGDAAIEGSFKIKIDFIAKSFDMAVNLSVNVADGLVKGNAGINMHASSDKWWFYIGEWKADNPQDYKPWEDKDRVNLDVKLGPIELNFNLYFMMGSDMPDLPPLPGVLLANMQGQGGAPIQDSRTGFGGFNAQTPGFGFGAGFHRTMDIKVLIFYADITFFAGFDVLLKNYSNVPGCEAIGINGWFARGQAFAYLNIKAGLDLDLWFYEGKFEIIDISAGAVLYAEFPNPNYVRANVFLSATILNGLISVNKNVRFEIGQKAQCGDWANPFGDLPIVSEMYPENGDEIEVYDDIRIAFNYPNKTFEVVNEEDPEGDPRRFYYRIMKSKLTKGNSEVSIIDEPIYTKDGYSAKYTTTNRAFLPEESELKFEFVVHGFEAIGGQQDPFLVEEEYTKTFMTKKRPDYVPATQLLSSRPKVRQRYFLKGDESWGFAEPFQGQNYAYLFDKSQIGDPEVFDQSKTQYLALIKEMGTGYVYEVPASWANSRMNFPLPQEIKNETIYQVRIIARMEYKPLPSNQAPGHPMQGGNNKIMANTWETGTEMQEIVEGAYKMNKYLLEDNSPKTYDHDLLKTEWFFRTSRYNTLSQKLADYQHAGTTHTDISSNYLPHIIEKDGKYSMQTQPQGEGIYFTTYKMPAVLVTGKEAFDVYDLYGYNWGDQFHQEHVPALLSFYNPNSQFTFHDDYYNTTHERFSFLNGLWPGLGAYFAEQFGHDRHENTFYFGDLSMKSRIRQIYSPNLMSGGQTDMIFQYYSKYGKIGNLALPAGTTVWKPHGPLTAEEINNAKNATPQIKKFNMQDVQLKVANVPKPNNPMQFNPTQFKENTFTQVYPLINLSDYLAIRDYDRTIRYIWWNMNNANKYMVHELQTTYLGPKLWRAKNNYSLKWGNESYNAILNINYPWSGTASKIGK